MPFYVGPVGLEYNDEGYDSFDRAITEVVQTVKTESEAQKLVDALTIQAIREGHYIYEDWAEWDYQTKSYQEVNPADMSDTDLLRKLDSGNSSVPMRLYTYIRG